MHGKLPVVAAVHGATRALWEGFLGLGAVGGIRRIIEMAPWAQANGGMSNADPTNTSKANQTQSSATRVRSSFSCAIKQRQSYRKHTISISLSINLTLTNKRSPPGALYTTSSSIPPARRLASYSQTPSAARHAACLYWVSVGQERTR